MPDRTPRFTAMAGAFYIATIQNPESRVCRRVGRAIARNSGLKLDRAVDVQCSFRTAQQLKKEGAIA